MAIIMGEKQSNPKPLGLGKAEALGIDQWKFLDLSFD